MKNSVPLLADFHRSLHKHNGVEHQPSLRARVRYGARLRRSVRRAEEEIDELFGLTNKRRNGSSFCFRD